MKLKNIFTAGLLALAAMTPGVASAEWGAWENYCTATFDAHYWYRKPVDNLKVDRRVDSSNPDRVQYRINDMFADSSTPASIIINANFAVNAPTAGDVAIWIEPQVVESIDVYGKVTDVYLSDAATYYENFFPSNPEYALEYEDASYFRLETGTFHIYSYYHYADGTVPFLDAFYNEQAQGPETLRLISPEFKNYTPEFGSATFSQQGEEYFYNIPVVLNDLSQIKMTVRTGALTNVRPVAEGMNDGSIACETITADGLASLQFAGTAGDFTLVYLTYKADGSAYQIGSQKFSYDPDWKSIGKATFTDGFISKFLEGDLTQNLGVTLSEADITYEVDVEESVSTPGRFRLVNPYGSTSPYWDLNFSVVTLAHNENNYMVIDATDPDKVFIEQNPSGFYYGSTPLLLLSTAYDWILEDYAIDQIPEMLWGKKVGDTITFAAGDKDNGLLMAKILSSTAEIYGQSLVVKLPSSGVEEVAADSDVDAPEVYYNLQGIRVNHPISDGIYICRKGSNVSKTIFR